MSLERNPARFLAANQHILRHHVIGDVVEADGRFPQGQTVAFGEAVNHARGGDRPHHRAAQAALFHEIFEGERHDFVRVYEVAAFVHRADAVRVAVGDDAEVAHPRTDSGCQRAEVFGNRLRMHTAKAGVHLAADFGNFTAGPLQKGFDDAAPRTVHCVHHEALGVVGDDVGVDERPQMVEVGGQGIELLNQPGFTRFLKIHQVGTACLLFVVVDIYFHAAALFRQSRPAECPLEFDAVIARRVVRGGNHHARNGFVMFDGVGDGGRGRIGLRQHDGETVGGEDARHFPGVTVGEEAGVEADHNLFGVGGLVAVAAFIPMFRSDGVCNGLSNHAQVAEGECIRNDGSPAVGSKVYGHALFLEAKEVFFSAVRLKGGYYTGYGVEVRGGVAEGCQLGTGVAVTRSDCSTQPSTRSPLTTAKTCTQTMLLTS